MSAYRVEVKKGRVWSIADVVRAKNAACAMTRVLNNREEVKDVTAIRAAREYKEVNCEA